MRYLFGFLCVCALGVVQVTGCGWGDPDPCVGFVCPPGENECTIAFCFAGTCNNFDPVEDGTPCLLDRTSPGEGMCESGACVAACDPASKEELPCPIGGLGDWFCCPGSDLCSEGCV
jgi:hypothetical protein